MTDKIENNTPELQPEKKAAKKPYRGGSRRKPADNSKNQAQAKNTGEIKKQPAANKKRRTPDNNKKKTESFNLADCKLKIIPLGGLGEVGKNMMVLEYEDSILVVDGGLSFPGDELLGIDLVIPDYTYLQENKDKIKGFLLTHGHEDHIGAIPYILKDLEDVPIYGTRLTLGLLRVKLQEFKIKNTKLVEIVPRQIVDLKPFKVEFIRVTHSIPDSVGLAIHTPVGVVVFSGDFKVDMTPVDSNIMDFTTLSRLGERGVLALFSDSTNAEKEGFSSSETTVGTALEKIFFTAPGRVIMTTFASNVHRVQQAVWAAEKCGRKVAIVGRGMQNVSTVAKELGYLNVPKGTQIDIEQINSFPADKLLILTTGSQGEPLSGLTRMSNGEHRQVQIGQGDTVVISANPIPGNEKLVGRTINKLYHLGANVVHEKSQGIHVSGHASREELKMMFKLIKPKFFIPIHGEYRMLYKHAQLAQQVGMPEDNVFVMENGQVLSMGRKRAQVSGTVTSGIVLIDGLGIGDVGHTVLKERRMLSQDGIVIVNMIINKRSKKIVCGPEFYSRGFIFEKEYEHIIDEAITKVAGVYAEAIAEGEFDPAAFKTQLRNLLAKFMSDRTGRRPIILPLINIV